MFFSKLLRLLFIALMLSGVAFGKVVTVKFGTVAPSGTPWADTLEQIKKRVDVESKGDLKINVYLGGQLGGELEILNDIRRGRIQGGGLTSAALASVITEMNVLEIPFIFDSYEEADFVLDNYLLEPFKKLFLDKGLVFVSWAENGWRNIGLKTKFAKTAKDLSGVKIRSQESQTHLAFWKKVNASAVPIAIPEVLSALQTGVVEGFDNTALFTLAADWQTGIKYYTVTQHIYQPAAVIYSKKFWDGINEAQRKTLMGEGNLLAPPSRKSVRSLGLELMDVLKSSGINVYTLTTKERDEFKNSVRGLDGEVVKMLGADSQKIYNLLLEGKAAFKKKGSKK
ncbi:MAG: C4-dicarboxylate ABC transporter substrate-binding protein [Bdellovibrionales bacterium GWA2_49_15]|nr:MAG: C4-dicarboxylate ABC transporter substrate-binding protein [Bdellovibrionales bacterium GWA2_49_15]HAZ14465.1 C4-dicarboxylate ABC transporter substrate-binding protein [Bdellovibrionales bacterium]